MKYAVIVKTNGYVKTVVFTDGYRYVRTEPCPPSTAELLLQSFGVVPIGVIEANGCNPCVLSGVIGVGDRKGMVVIHTAKGDVCKRVEVNGKPIRAWDNLGRVIMMCVRYILVLDRLETSDVGVLGTDVGHPEWGGQQCGEG